MEGQVEETTAEKKAIKRNAKGQIKSNKPWYKRWKQTLITCVIFLCIIAGGGFGAWQAYEQILKPAEFTAGHQNGYAQGYGNGLSEGRDQGRAAGFEEGKQKALQELAEKQRREQQRLDALAEAQKRDSWWEKTKDFVVFWK